jgi:hypothetical protein
MTQKQAQAIADEMLEVGHFWFEGASWEFYDYILKQRDAGGLHARITYDRGQMEIFTGADVQGALDRTLAEFLRDVEFEADVPVASVSDLTADDDVVYVISSVPVQEAPASAVGAESGPQRSFELRVNRSRVLPGGSDWNGGAVEPGTIKFKGIVRALGEGGVFVALPGSVKFPGIEVRKLFEFVYAGKGGKKK